MSLTGFLFIDLIISPDLIPAFAAGPLGSYILSTFNPLIVPP